MAQPCRHLHYTHNFKGDPPPRAEKKKKTAAVLVEKYKAEPQERQPRLHGEVTIVLKPPEKL